MYKHLWNKTIGPTCTPGIPEEVVPLFVLPGRLQEETDIQAAKNKRYPPTNYWQHVRNQRKRSADGAEQSPEVKSYSFLN